MSVARKQAVLKEPQKSVLLAIQPFGKAGAEAVPAAYDGLALVPDPLLAVFGVPPAVRTRESKSVKPRPRDANTLHYS